MASVSPRRIAYYDWLRTFATAAVVLLHCASLDWHTANPRGSGWAALNLYDSAVRWCVPIFFMLTGALFLGRGSALEPARFLRRSLPRLVSAFLVWTLVYIAVAVGFHEFTLRQELTRLPVAYYHLWFLPAIIGVYLALPLLWWIARERPYLRYFLLLGAATAWLAPFARQDRTGTATDVLTAFSPPAVAGYAVLVVAGYLLATTKRRFPTWSLLVVALLGFASTAALTWASARLKGQATEVWYAYTTANVMVTAGAVFLLLRQARFAQSAGRVVNWLSDYSFGVYLVHPLLLLALAHLVPGLVHNPFVGPPVATLLVLAASYPVSWLLKNIPVVGQYIA